ncbi:MAG: c-type cytochrome [Nitrospirales bacterium]
MKIWLSLGCIVIGLLVLTIWILPGAFSAKGTPSDLEVSLARLARHWATPSDLRDAKNPIPSEPKYLAEALHHFADHCASCHANDGSGKTPMGPNFYPPVPDLRDQVIQSMSDGELFYVIHYGVRFTGMPAWGNGEPEKDTESWKLVHFIRHLPNITPQEIATMKSMNPTTQAERDEQEALDRFLAGEDFEPAAEHHH